MSPSVLLLALQVAATPASGLSPAEQHYVDARAAANERFGKGAGPEDAERRAMADLEAQLRAIVGPVRLPGLSGVGKLAYDGFWGVGSQKTADGLFFQWREDRLFVTTRSLYERAVDWARAQMRRSTTGRSAEDNRAVDQELASVTVSCDAAYLAFADVPVRHDPSTRLARATMGYFAQMDGPYPPRDLIVVIARGDRVYMVGATLEPPPERLPACDAAWGPDLKRDGDLSAYRRCIASMLPARPSFAGVVKRAQEIVDLIERDGRRSSAR